MNIQLIDVMLTLLRDLIGSKFITGPVGFESMRYMGTVYLFISCAWISYICYFETRHEIQRKLEYNEN